MVIYRAHWATSQVKKIVEIYKQILKDGSGMMNKQ